MQCNYLFGITYHRDVCIQLGEVSIFCINWRIKYVSKTFFEMMTIRWNIEFFSMIIIECGQQIKIIANYNI